MHYHFKDLVYLMSRLRDPETGCSWDLEQDFHSIAPYTLEETCELLDAIANHDHDNLREELGDVLFQVVFHAQMAREQSLFDLEDVVDEIVRKMIRRHPHVFPDGTLDSVRGHDDTISPDQVTDQWQQIKTMEKEKAASTGVSDGIPAALPSLERARTIQKNAAKVGFDWAAVSTVYDKIQEELQELQEAESEGQDRVTEEMGDLLFACVNLARHLKVNPEMALRQATGKFERRFHTMQRLALADELDFPQLSLDEMEAYWQQGKGEERDD